MDVILVTFVRWVLSLAIAALVMGPMLLTFWYAKPKWAQKFRINQPKTSPPLFKIELKRSVLGLSLYILPSTLLYILTKYLNYTPMYTDINKYGVAYLFFTFALFIVAVDTWFYWAHRLMHWHPFFARAHAIHHESYNINPLSAYSVDIVHGILNIIPYAMVLLFVPWHPYPVLAFGIFSLFYNAYIHLGYDLPQRAVQKIWPLRIIYTASHHAVHHHDYDHNFSAYFTFWDKVMKTEKITCKSLPRKNEE